MNVPREAQTSPDAGEISNFWLTHAPVVCGTLRGEAFLMGEPLGKFWQNGTGVMHREMKTRLEDLTENVIFNEEEGRVIIFWRRAMNPHAVQIVLSYEYDAAKEARRRMQELMKTENRFRSLDADWEC